MKKCKACGEEIYFEQTKTGKYMPRNIKDKEPHWATCPQANKFRKKNRKDGKNETTKS